LNANIYDFVFDSRGGLIVLRNESARVKTNKLDFAWVKMADEAKIQCFLCTNSASRENFHKHLYALHAANLSVGVVRRLAELGFPSFLCEYCNPHHWVEWQDVQVHRDFVQSPSESKRRASGSGSAAGSGSGSGSGSRILHSFSSLPAAQPAQAPRAAKNTDSLVRQLLEGGRILDDVPSYALHLFMSVSDKLARHALAAKQTGRQLEWEDRVVTWITTINGLLKRVRGGKRGQYALLHRMSAFMADLDSAFESRGSPDGAEVKADGKEEKKDLPARSNEERAISRAVSLLRARFVHKAAQSLLHEGGRVAHTDAIRAELIEKIPQIPPADLPPLPAGCGAVLIAADHDLVKQIRKAASRGAAPGPTQISARHLKHVVNSDIGRQFVAAILSDLCSGSFSDDMKPVFLTAVGARIPKAGGGVRPICCGDVFYRLACSYLIRGSQSSLADAVGPHQLGVGTSSGCEKIVHALQAVLEEPRFGLACLEIDIVNAFNTRGRAGIFKSLFSHPDLRQLWQLCRWSYAESSPVHFLDGGAIVQTLQFREGVKQGCPAGGSLFALDIARDCKAAAAVNPLVKVVAYYDNVYLVVPPPNSFVLPLSASVKSPFSTVLLST